MQSVTSNAVYNAVYNTITLNSGSTLKGVLRQLYSYIDSPAGTFIKFKCSNIDNIGSLFGIATIGFYKDVHGLFYNQINSYGTYINGQFSIFDANEDAIYVGLNQVIVN
jgi:hypothetical protein